MKKLNLSLLLIIATLVAFSQVPASFNYQAVVRNSSGEIITNKTVSFRITLLKGSESGSVVYSETHSLSTNEFGLVNFKIGKGTKISGEFSPANWGEVIFTKVEFDPAGGSSFSTLATTKLSSVPFAFVAQTVVNDKVNDADADPENEIQILTLNGTLLELSKGGGSVTLPTTGSSGGDNWGAQTVKTDATLTGDGLSTSPLSVVGDLTDDQTLSISGNDLSISGGNTVTLPSGSSSLWTKSGDKISYDGAVGIGVVPDYDSPSLDVRTTGNIAAIYTTNNSELNPPFQAYNQNANGAAAYFRNKIRIKDGTEGAGKVLTSDVDGFTTWQTPIWGKDYAGINYSKNVGLGMESDNYVRLSVDAPDGILPFAAYSNGTDPAIFSKSYGGGVAAWFDGQIKISDSSKGAGKVLTSDANGLASWQTPATSSSLWTKTDDEISYNGAVGIGTTNIVGDLYKLTMGGNIHMLNNSVDYISQLHFNDNLRFYDESNDNYLIFKYGDSDYGGIKFYDGNNYCQGIICSDGDNSFPSFGLKDSDGDWAIQVRRDSYTRFLVNNIEKMRIESNGNVGIGTTSPDAKLHLIGKIKIVDGVQSDGKVLTSDTNGLASWVTPTWIVNGSNVYRSSGNVGIGTTSPAAPLEIKSNANPALIIGSATAGSPVRPGIQFKNNTSQWIAGDDGSDEIFGFYSQWNSARTYDAKLRVYGKAAGSWGKYIQLTHNGTTGFISTDEGDINIAPVTGNVGINISTPTQALDVSGNIRVRSIASGAYYGSVNRTSDGTLTTASSDIRLKENIRTLDNSLDKILKLRGVTFTWKAKPEYGTRIGFIAQEFEKVIPELAFTNPVDGYKGINYAEVTAVLVEAVKEQQKQIETLKAENSRLKADNSEFESRLKKLENMVTTGYASK